MTIQYVDVMSLYPYIWKYFKFSVGHPIVHVGYKCKEIEACLPREGLMKYSFVPPEKLYHPILPFRCNNTHIFCIGTACVQASSSVEDSDHTRDKHRALTGT